MHLLTNSKSLFDFITKGSRRSEKWMNLDFHTAGQVYQAKEIPYTVSDLFAQIINRPMD